MPAFSFATSGGGGGSIVSPTGSTWQLFNSADQVTNYERFRVNWTTNVLNLGTEFAGTATARVLQIGVAATAGAAINTYLKIQPASAPFFSFARSSSALGAFINLDDGVTAFINPLASSGTQIAFDCNPRISQTGTAAYTAFQINPTETTTGSGIRSLLDAAVGGSLRARLFAADPGTTGAILTLYTSGTARLTFGTTSGYSAIYAGTVSATTYRFATNDVDIILNTGVGGRHYFGSQASAAGIIFNDTGTIETYRGVLTAGRGVVAIYAAGRSTTQTAAVASVATYTNTAVDGTYEVSANVLVTTATSHAFTVTCSYTDEGNTARTVTMSFSLLAGGAMTTSVANANGAVPYMGIPLTIRSKASTAITIATTGTFTTVTYNVEGFIKRLS